MTSSVLDATGLSKSFKDVKAVSDVSLRIDPGEILGLLGPNGAGKTTTISMICGLIQPDDGSVQVAGFDIRSETGQALRSMGVVPQEIALYEDLSPRENLIFWGKLAGLSGSDAKQRSSELLEELSLLDRQNDRIKTLSGGMKRRINIGCALMHSPTLLLLDEPTVGIDPQARAKILDFVRGLTKKGTGILYTTHYLEEAESLCDRIGIIDHGSILAEGTLVELQRRVAGDQMFVLEGAFHNVDTQSWPGFHDRFRVLQQSDQQLVVDSILERAPTDSLRELLDVPVRIENASIKRPNLNDVFLQVTGRELRE